jgi:hypothetical protein
MTRAKTELVMTWRREVSAFTNSGIRTFVRSRSRFLDVLTDQKGRENRTNNSVQAADTNLINSASKSSYQFQARKTYSTVVPKGSNIPHPKESRSRNTPLDKRVNINESYSSLPSAFDKRLSKASTTSLTKMSSTLSNQHRKNGIDKARQSKAGSVLQASKERIDTLRKAHILKQEVHRRNISRRDENVPAKSMTTSLNAGVSKAKKASSEANPKADSTWFFPVGSRVTHKKLGTGVVLPPKSTARQDNMVVHIAFPNGEKHEYPLNGSDISPIAH